MAKIEVGEKVAVVSLDKDDMQNPSTMKAFNQLMNDWHEALAEEGKSIAEELGISQHCADCVQYLRTRSRWTQEKENQLIEWDHEGKELPNVFAGEF